MDIMLATAVLNMKRMKKLLVMADSVAEIHRGDAADKELEKQQKNKVYDEKTPSSVRKLEERGRHVGILTVGDIESIIFAFYNIIGWFEAEED